jgi:hypothetical protein
VIGLWEREWLEREWLWRALLLFRGRGREVVAFEFVGLEFKF